MVWNRKKKSSQVKSSRGATHWWPALILIFFKNAWDLTNSSAVAKSFFSLNSAISVGHSQNTEYCNDFVFNQRNWKMTTIEEAEKRMSQIESKILQLESSSPSTTDASAALQNYQKQMLDRLKVVRETLVQEVEFYLLFSFGLMEWLDSFVTFHAAQGGDIAKITQERDAALEENAKLKKEMDRLQYRVQHLIKALNAEESKNAKWLQPGYNIKNKNHLEQPCISLFSWNLFGSNRISATNRINLPK